ncbi:phosphoglycerate mutase family protein [Aspergillus steynii IBT 23096]|uniref:Phosphoglycerate mutase family protein n=1 Tax=Aspergillus steynii IBT 23096 TaxID=1392250 RepID=A0A2I2GIW1_9EURO|nr:phosphoglycerate mutase family protein [Aspergillus steynii IBT 23096]PLB52825.1 phosphoglycerate mutase family protein [Aspergillus steynii IBT 23096]
MIPTRVVNSSFLGGRLYSTSTRHLYRSDIAMPPIIHFVRHAQGTHNISLEHSHIPDPTITEHGIQQCHELERDFPRHSHVDLVVSSPFRRTLYTALKSFGPVFKANPKMEMLLHSDLQEVSDFPCDVGSERAALESEIRDEKVPADMSLISDGWQLKRGRHAPTREAITLRARDMRCWLKARPEKEIVVVTHGGLLHYLTEDWEENCRCTGTGWMNTEYRTYEFTDEVHDDLGGIDLQGRNVSLVETEESRTRRGKPRSPPTREEQRTLYKLGFEGWAAQGLCMNVAELEAKNKTGTA